MTIKDKQNIRILFHFYRYNEGSLSRLYGVTQQRISDILLEEGMTATPQDECLLCGLDEAKQYFIDGDDMNEKPQNKIMLCEPDKKRIEHMQMRKNKGSVRSNY